MVLYAYQNRKGPIIDRWSLRSLYKARIFEESFAEVGIGFVERHGVYKPWIVLHFGGQHDLGKDYIEQFADVIISEDEAYCLHTQNKTIPLHADEDELDEIVEELRGQLFKYKACFQDITIIKGFQVKIRHWKSAARGVCAHKTSLLLLCNSFIYLNESGFIYW